MKINNLKKDALKKGIPIITDESLKIIINIIKENNYKTILEIGSAVGYSAIMMSSYVEKIVTIERNKDLSLEAKININKFNLDNKIHLIEEDALNLNINKKFDLIFIDAAKAQYIRFFEKYKENLKENGVIVCDNINFHNLDLNKVSKSTKQLITKLNKFKEYLKNHQSFNTVFYNDGDGLSVSRRIK